MNRKRIETREPQLPAPLRLAPYLLIVVAAIVAIGPALRGGFVSMDDPGTISRNPLLNPPTLGSLGHYWTHAARGLYAPLTYTAWIALAAIARSPGGLGATGAAAGGSLDPAVFHAFNLFVHAGSALIVAAIVRVLIERDWPAIVGASIFAVHPLQVEAVAWASGTKDLLAGFFGLAAILLYLISTLRSQLDGGRPRGWRSLWYIAATVSFVLALLSKPSAMTIPAVAFVLDWIAQRRQIRSIARALWPWFALSVACMVIAWIVQPAPRADPSPLWSRPLIAGDSLAFYLGKLVAPVRLAVCYGRPPRDLMTQPWFFIAWIVPAAIAALLWWKRRDWPVLAASALVFAIAPSPMLGLVRFDYQYYSTVADHYLYVAMLGAALAAAWAVKRLGSATLSPAASRAASSAASRGTSPVRSSLVSTLALIGSFAAIVVLTVLSNRQSRLWRDDGTLFGHSVEVAPRGLLALHNLGNYYEHSGDRPRAARLYRQALEVNPEHYESMGALAGTLSRMGESDEAVRWFEKFLEHERALPPASRPREYPDHLFAFAHTLMSRGEYERAAHYFELALSERPGDPWIARGLSEARAKSRAGN